MASVVEDRVSARALLEIHPVAGRIGAEIRGISLSGDLDAATVAAINAAIVKHKVVFFREQSQFDAPTHEGFATLLDELYVHPTISANGQAQRLMSLEATEAYGAATWHTDVTFVAAYPKYSIMCGLVVPNVGGDTLWANTATAYEGLPDDLKRLVDGLWAFHDNRFDYGADGHLVGGAVRDESDYMDTFSSVIFQAEHPVVHVHPESGERNLIGGVFLRRYIGFGEAESHRLYSILQDHITKPENTVRWRWKAGDVAIWDNRATQHRAIADFGAERRSLRRATVGTMTPVSIDGRASRIIKQIKG